MSRVKIISANSKPIQSSGKALKQNYGFKNGLPDSILFELEFPAMATFSFFFILKTVQTVATSNLGNSTYMNFNTFDVDDNLVAKHIGENNNLIGKTYQYDTIGGEQIFNGSYNNHIGQIPNRTDYFLYQVNGSTLKYRQPPANFNYSITLPGAIGRNITRFRKVNGGADNWFYTRLVVFNRTLTDREISFLFNNGNSNPVLSSLGLIAEFNFELAEVLQREGVDTPAFANSITPAFPLWIIGGLPVGTASEQVDHINNNELRRWAF